MARSPRIAEIIDSILVRRSPLTPWNWSENSGQASRTPPDCRSWGAVSVSECCGVAKPQRAQLLRSKNSCADATIQKSALGSSQTLLDAPTRSVLHELLKA